VKRLLLVVASLLLAVSFGANASAEVTLQTRVSTKRPEVGESFSVQLTALGDAGEQPSSPALVAPAGFSMHGPSTASQQQVSIAGGRISHRHGITATWTLTPTRPGHFTIGPPTVMIGGRRMQGDRISVEVVPAGQGQRTPGFDPLDPFALPGLPRMPRLPQMPPLFGTDDPADSLPPYPPELQIERAPDGYAFLRAVATPNRVVVGQQVSLKIYAYGRQGPFREASTSEPSRPDFIAHTIVENSYGERNYRVPIEGNVWIAQKVRELALFPIRSGTLVIGPMKMAFEGRGYPSAGGKGLPRESAPIEIAVTEPPLAGRPPGYRIGDVGQYSLTASVEPRELMAGEAVSVVATLEGTGNVPFKLRVPQQHGVDWLDPTIVDDVEVRGSTVSGTRKLGYIVRVQRAGKLELGELSLPFWDPERDAYRVARAQLGTVDVQPNPDQSYDPDKAIGDRLQGIVTPRKSLGAASAPRRPWSDSIWYWLLLALGPLGVALTGGGIRAARRLHERALKARGSAGSIASRELAGARRAGDLRDVASHVERALVAAIEASTGLRARGILRAELADALAERGVASEAADEIRALLDVCDDIRFTRQAGHAAERDLPTRAEAAIKALTKREARRLGSVPPASAAARDSMSAPLSADAGRSGA
jgi:hypothetical protein